MIGVIRRNPIPVIALIGLVAGSIIRWAIGDPDTARIVWLVALVIAGAPLVWETVRGMIAGNFASDVVAMLAIVASVGMGEYFAGVLVVLMQSGGEALERYGLRRASSSLEALLKRAPRTAWRITGEGLREVDVTSVEIGDRLMVRHGDLVPVDGKLLSERADVDEAALTGEPLSRSKLRDEQVMSGSINLGDVFEMRADQVSSKSQYARIVELVRAAQEEKPPIQRLADQYAVWFTPLTILVCAWGWLYTGDPRTILSVLVVATPCPLILATPIAIISGINRAARAGIIVKGGAAIEQIGRVRAIVFDKTGTLTIGTPTVEQIEPLNGVTSHELLRLAGSAEQVSSHVLARALVDTAIDHVGALPSPTSVREAAGRGVIAEIDGSQVVVGSARFVGERYGADVLDRFVHRDIGASQPIALIGIDGKLAGIVRYRDQLRPGVTALMQRLRSLGVARLVMLTGDHELHAQAIAREAQVDHFEAELLPEHKVDALHRLAQHYQPVAMVGDGINDAPALATATVGVAMGAHGTGISAEAADMVLLVDDISLVGEAVAIGQHTITIARQSIFIGLGLSFVLMLVASVGLIPPAVGALCQEVVDVAVILNALRAR